MLDSDFFEHNRSQMIENSPISLILNIIKQLSILNLNNEEIELIQQFCLEYSGLFYPKGDNLNFSNEINLTYYGKTSNTKSYHYPHVPKKEVEVKVPKTLKHGIIRPSNVVKWYFPVWFLHKKLDTS